MIKDFIKKTRTIRRFDSSKKINNDVLLDLIDTSRFTPSASNKQPLKYYIANDEATNKDIFKCLSWAGALNKWDGPIEGNRPVSYIIVLGDKKISSNFDIDLGISAYSIMLAAKEKGIGMCMLGAINREKIRNILKIKNTLEVLLVLALGYPNEEVVIEKVIGNNINYFRDEKDVHHVPKRDIDDIIIS